MFRQDPGPCPICGAAHSACTADSGPITLVQLPQRDALQAQAIEPSVQTHEPPAELQRPSDDGVDGVMGEGPEPFTTANYDRKKHGPKRPH
jgi:hypothetical protein